MPTRNKTTGEKACFIGAGVRTPGDLQRIDFVSDQNASVSAWRSRSNSRASSVSRLSQPQLRAAPVPARRKGPR